VKLILLFLLIGAMTWWSHSEARPEQGDEAVSQA